MLKHLHRAILVLLLYALMGSPATAHTDLPSTTPNDGAVLERPPLEVRIQFADTLEGKVGTLLLEDEAGRPIAGAVPSAAGRSALTLRLPPLPNGEYRARWTVLSRDSHVAQGLISFRVAGPRAGGVLTQPGAVTGGPGAPDDTGGLTSSPGADVLSRALKVAQLLGAVLVIGVPHILLVRPRLSAGSGQPVRAVQWLQWLVMGEVVLGLAVIAAAGVLTMQAPP